MSEIAVIRCGVCGGGTMMFASARAVLDNIEDARMALDDGDYEVVESAQDITFCDCERTQEDE